MIVDPKLVHRILEGYTLAPMGTHGLPHWARVLQNGLRVAELTGANERVVAYFAVFHDARRVNEGTDAGHGRRGAELARELREEWLNLEDGEFALLAEACEYHTDGKLEADVTVQTCWDADRLDLWRVGIEPEPALMCTDAARDGEVWEWARGRRSLYVNAPGFVRTQWNPPSR